MSPIKPYGDNDEMIKKIDKFFQRTAQRTALGVDWGRKDAARLGLPLCRPIKEHKIEHKVSAPIK